MLLVGWTGAVILLKNVYIEWYQTKIYLVIQDHLKVKAGAKIIYYNIYNKWIKSYSTANAISSNKFLVG